MKTYCNLLKPQPHYRRELFDGGFQRLGYTPSRASNCDVLLIWNRFRHTHEIANGAEARGATVLVVENATWGNDAFGHKWYSLWRGVHNVTTGIHDGGSGRWDALGVEPAPWRDGGGEAVGLPQRSIGPPGMAMPKGWVPPGCDRIRPHPGVWPCLPLEQDLSRASRVVTWASGAAVKAALWGIRVESHLAGWAGAQENTDAGRLKMLRQLAWAQWRHDEIATGVALEWMLPA